MVEIKKNLWLLPLISGILSIIALITPAVLYSEVVTMWVWGLEYEAGMVDEFRLAGGAFIIGPAIILYVVILVILLIRSGFKVKNGKKEIEKAVKTWIIIGLLIVLFVSFWIINKEITWPHDFWAISTPHFGIYALYIAGVLPILGFILQKTLK